MTTHEIVILLMFCLFQNSRIIWSKVVQIVERVLEIHLKIFHDVMYKQFLKNSIRIGSFKIA